MTWKYKYLHKKVTHLSPMSLFFWLLTARVMSAENTIMQLLRTDHCECSNPSIAVCMSVANILVHVFATHHTLAVEDHGSAWTSETLVSCGGHDVSVVERTGDHT